MDIDLDYYGVLFLSIFFLSTPAAVIATYWFNVDRIKCAILNSYGFSSAMIAMYLYPFIVPTASPGYDLKNRIHKATMNWIIWLSVFTEVVFQIPHNLFVKNLDVAKGTPLEWPFYSYGLSDSRWSNYHNGTGLSPEVWLINWNDAGLGILVLIALVYYYTHQKNVKSTVALVLITLFRDATLWRETVEYMWDHHRKSYHLTTQDSVYRHHAILLLWLVNGIWLIAPVVTILWSYYQIMDIANLQLTKDKKK